MFETMTQIAKRYNIEAKEVGKLLYTLKIRDVKHPIQKGFPFEQAITHGIAKAYEAPDGGQYYRYNINPIKEEFERMANALTLADKIETPSQDLKSTTQHNAPNDIESTLKMMLVSLNKVLDGGEIEQLYHLKSHIADIYALLPQKAS